MLEYPPGWTCELTALRLESYIISTLPRRDALAVAEHLEACPSCWQLILLRGVKRTARG